MRSQWGRQAGTYPHSHPTGILLEADAVSWLRNSPGFSHNCLSLNAHIDPILKELIAVTRVIYLFRSLHLMRNFSLLQVTPFPSTYCNLVWATSTKKHLNEGKVMQNNIIRYITRLENRVVRDLYSLSVPAFELTIFIIMGLRTIYCARTVFTEYFQSLASLEQLSKNYSF